MKNFYELSKEEKKSLKERGFFVKKIKGTNDFISQHNFIIYLNTFIVLFLFFTPFLFLLFIPKVLKFFFQYGILPQLKVISPSTIFYGNHGKFMFSGLVSDYKMKNNKPMKDYYDISKGKYLAGGYIMWGWFSILGAYWTFGLTYEPLLALLFPVFLYCGSYFLLLFSRALMDTFHPLYVFGNIGEKIQYLTTTIEGESQRMQDIFRNDMNFAILRDSFGSLSQAFSQVTRMVAKLESIEDRANKGNLFDSRKYIHSLRDDIVKPLKQLKSFLEDQREKLESSQEELKKIRVNIGGPRELEEASRLSSIRSGPIITELTENIAKLDVMISKICA